MKILPYILVAFSFMAAGLSAMAEELPFSQKTFDELRTAGKPVVLHVHAPWCNVCKKQAEIVSSLMKDAQFKNVTVLRADFDTEKDVQRALNIPYRSTFVAFKGQAEVGRSSGDTNADSIAALFRKAM
jgi:thiol-disulfide isomerase/thioredoxin